MIVRGETPPHREDNTMGINIALKCWPWFLLALIIGAGLGW